MTRRDFVRASAVGVSASGYVWGQSNQAKLERVGCMTLSFNSVLKSANNPNDPNRTLDILDAPQMLADRYGIHHVEFQHTHFEATDAAYLKEVRARLAKAKSQMNQICLEFGPMNISTPDNTLRQQTIDLTKAWVDHAADVGCPRVMVNQGTLAPDVRAKAIETLKIMADYGSKKKVFITMENRGGGGGRGPAAGAAPAPPPPPPWQTVVEVIKASGIYANPDIGNFPNEEERHAGLRVMYPLSSGSSHAHYAPERYSEADAVKISKEVGYKGLYSIEGGRNNGPDPYAAVQSIVEELLKDIG